MPQKLGNGGHSQETYDPSTGKYIEDGKENKYYDNPGEKIFSAPVTDAQMDFLRNYLKNKNVLSSVDSNDDKDVKGKDEIFKNNFRRKMNGILPISANGFENKKNQILFNELLNDIENIENENVKGILKKAINEYKITLPREKNNGKRTAYFSVFEKEVAVSRDDIDHYNPKNFHGRGVVFFHEFGHAVDQLIALKINNITYNGLNDISDLSDLNNLIFKQNNGKFNASISFVSKENKTMQSVLEKEKEGINFDEILKAEKEDFVPNSELNISSYQELRERKDEINEQKINFEKEIENDINNKVREKFEYFKYLEQNGCYIRFEIYERKPKMFSSDDDWLYENVLSVPGKQNELKKINNFINDYFQQSGLSDKYSDILKERTKLYEEEDYQQKIKAENWGGISDLLSYCTGKTLSCKTGHNSEYYSDKKNGVIEAFANIFQAKCNNKRQYDNFKKFFPQTVEIFEEIMDYVKEII